MAHREIVNKLDVSINSHEDDGYGTLSVPLHTDSIQTRPKRSMMSAERFGEPSTIQAELKPEKEGRLSMTTETSLATVSTSSSVESLNTLQEKPSPLLPKLNSALTPFYPPSENNHNQKSSLCHAKEWNFVQRLLSFLTIILPIKLPLTFTSLARAGFFAYKEKSGGSYACAHCNLVIGEFPSAGVDNPEAYHRSVSPNCPFFCESQNQEAVEPTVNHGNQNQDSGFEGSMEISVSESDTAQGSYSSLITRTLSAGGGAGSPGSSSVEGASYDAVVTRSREAALINMGKDTEHYTMQRQLKHTMCVERNRRRTFKQHHLLDTKITKYYAASGLYLTELRGDLTLRCAWCKFSYSFTKEMASDRELALTVLNKHIGDPQSNSPPCDFISGRNHTLKNIPDLYNKECWKSLTKPDIAETDLSVQLSNLGISNQSAKYPGMAVSERRRNSFLTYISETTQQIDSLVEAGYFYSSGNTDSVVCFMCGLVSSNWSISETPWQRHTRSSPSCQHVIVQKGQEFIQSTIEQYGEYRESKNTDRINNVTTRMLRPRMDTHVVQQAIKLGIKRDSVKTVVSNRIKAGERDFRYLEEIIIAVQDLSTPQSLLNNRLLTERKFPEIICQPHQDNLSDDEDEAMDGEGTGIGAPSVGLSDMGDNTEEERLRDADAEEQERKAIQDFGRDMDMTQLKSTLTCKICLTDLISIIFVPCGHLVCCTSCAAAMTSCPICRKEVSGTIRAKFS